MIKVLPRIQNAHDPATRNIINATIDSTNAQGKAIQDLVAKGQLTPAQYATLIQSVNGLIAKGEVSLDDFDWNKGKITQGMVSTQLLNQIAGDAPVLSEVAPGSVTIDGLAFNKESSNKFDVSKVVNASLNYWNGEVVADPNFRTSPMINVTKASKYILSTARAIVYYDSAEVYVGSDGDASIRKNYVTTPPENATYMRFHYAPSDSSSPIQVNAGATLLPYEEYYNFIDGKYLEPRKISNDDLEVGIVSADKTDFIQTGKNLVNPELYTIGYYVVPTNGTLMGNAEYVTTNHINVESGSNYVANVPIRFLAFYKADGGHISGMSNVARGDLIKIPANGATIRLSLTELNSGSFQFEKGDKITPFEPYGYVIPKLLKSDNNSSVSEREIDVYGKWNMKNFISQASKYINPSFSERLEVAIIGDSWVRSKHRITQPLRNILKEKYGNGGIGSVGFAEIRLAPAETQIVTTGTWTAVNRVKGLDMRQYQSSSVGSTIKLTTSENSTELEIHHIKQVGSYRYRINGGTWKTVDTSTGTFVHDDTFTKSNVTLEIEVLSGTVALLNAYLFNGNRGAVVHQWGYGGATAGDFAGIDRSHFIAELKKTNVKSIGILLGTNDMAQNVGIDSFKENISEIVSRIKSTNSLLDVFLIAPSGNNLSRSYTMKEYDEAMYDLSLEHNISYVSLYKNMGTYEEQNARGLFEDDVHPNTDGGYIIGNIVYDRLFKI